MPDSFPEMFSALRAILQRHTGKLVVNEDSPTRFCLEGGLHPKHKEPMPIAWIEIRRVTSAFTTWAFMPARTSKKLRARMQGKACFNFASLDEPLFAELEQLTVRAFEAFKKLPYMQ